MSATSFKGYNDIGEFSFNETLEANVRNFIDWGLLGLGAFHNIHIPTSGAYGGNAHLLRRVSDPRYTDGRVWEGFRKNWCWESGIGYSSDPIQVSGLFIGNTFYPKNSGYFIDYPNGRVIFDTPLPASSSVKIEFSAKWVQVESFDSLPFFRTGQQRSFRIDSSYYTSGSGDWSILSDKRYQFPVIGVEAVTDKDYEGYQLGGGQKSENKVLIHVIGEDKPAVSRLANIMADQGDKTIYLYDLNRMASNNAFPLDYRGSMSANPKTYPLLIAPTGDGGFRYTSRVQNGTIFIHDTSEQGPEKLGELYHAVVEWNVEAILHTI